MGRAKGKVTLTKDAASFLHKSCKHINDKGQVVIFDATGIIRVQRKADKRELEMCPPLELLCLERK